MSKYADRLMEYIDEHPEFIQPDGTEKRDDEQLPASRASRTCASPAPRFNWGIPVEFDPKHVVYVWLDALTNYITGMRLRLRTASSEEQLQEATGPRTCT